MTAIQLLEELKKQKQNHSLVFGDCDQSFESGYSEDSVLEFEEFAISNFENSVVSFDYNGSKKISTIKEYLSIRLYSLLIRNKVDTVKEFYELRNQLINKPGFGKNSISETKEFFLESEVFYQHFCI